MKKNCPACNACNVQVWLSEGASRRELEREYCDNCTECDEGGSSFFSDGYDCFDEE